jgi:diadenosine tetraphosphatase ApaH/serine/threonine PP2A family protein phosphatase
VRESPTSDRDDGQAPWETRYATCDLCGHTTDPEESVLGVPNPGSVTVRGDVGQRELVHTDCIERQNKGDLSDFM